MGLPGDLGSLKLSQDVIYEQPLNTLPTNGWQLSVLYTTLIRQWALTDSGYAYMSILQKSTESLGSISGAPPPPPRKWHTFYTLNIMTKGSKKAPMPKSIAPMLCTLTKEPPNDPDYLYEIKWDGYRIISYVQKAKVRMDSRSAKDYTKRY